jgi:hypothetical protein
VYHQKIPSYFPPTLPTFEKNTVINKTLSLFTLLAIIACCCSFTTQIDSSIIGTWTQAEILTVTKHRGTSSADTTISYDKGFAITFTIDSQYHYTAPYGHKANGTYMISEDMLQEIAKTGISTSWYKILLLTEHKMVLQAIGPAKENGTNAATTYSYTR